MTWRSRRRSSATRPATTLAGLAAAHCPFTAASARADWLADINGSSTEPFCPLIYGPMCELSLSIVTVLYILALAAK